MPDEATVFPDSTGGWADGAVLGQAWTKLLSDADTAPVFADLVHRPLHRDLTARFPTTDPDHLFTAASDAVLAFLKKPASYDPDRSPLPAYLRMIGKGRLLNILASERRHHDGRIPWDSVELGITARNEEESELSFDAPELAPVLAKLTEAERGVFDLMCDGERATAVFAEALGIGGLPTEQQEAEVKRVKDRIMARLKRAAGGSNG